MKKLLFVLTALLLIPSISAFSIGSIRYFDDIFLVNTRNTGLEDIEELSVKIIIMDEEYDIYKSKSFDLDVKENKGTYVIIEEPLKQETLVKVIVTNGERRVKYMII